LPTKDEIIPAVPQPGSLIAGDGTISVRRAARGCLAKNRSMIGRRIVAAMESAHPIVRSPWARMTLVGMNQELPDKGFLVTASDDLIIWARTGRQRHRDESDEALGGDTIPSSVLSLHAERQLLMELPVDFPVTRWPVAIVMVRNRTMGPLVERFVECAREVTRSFAGRTASPPLRSNDRTRRAQQR